MRDGHGDHADRHPGADIAVPPDDGGRVDDHPAEVADVEAGTDLAGPRDMDVRLGGNVGESQSP